MALPTTISHSIFSSPTTIKPQIPFLIPFPPKQSPTKKSLPTISCISSTPINSITHDTVSEDEVAKAESKLGSKVRVKVPLKVYHVSKLPELDLNGRTGVLKQYVGVHKGKRISANLPYKVEFVVDEVLGRDGKGLKFVAHLKEDEYELL